MSNRVIQVPFAEYRAIKRMNQSGLSAAKRTSWAHYKHSLLVPDKTTDSQQFGTAVHTAVLEPENWKRDVAVWDGPSRRGKAWEAFKAANGHRTILTREQHNRASDAAHSLLNDPQCGGWLRGERRNEVTVLWEHGGVELKARLDAVTPNAILDVKTTRSILPKDLENSIVSYDYAMQAAFYQDAWHFVDDRTLPVVLLFVESQAPHCCVPWIVDQRSIADGRRQYQDLLSQYKKCLDTGVWPGPYSEPFSRPMDAYDQIVQTIGDKKCS